MAGENLRTEAEQWNDDQNQYRQDDRQDDFDHEHTSRLHFRHIRFRCVLQTGRIDLLRD